MACSSNLALITIYSKFICHTQVSIIYFTAPPRKPPQPILLGTGFCAAILTCDLRGKKDDEEVFVVVHNTATKEEVYHQQYFEALYLKEVNISNLSPDTVYAAQICARNTEITDLITVSETLLFTTPGMYCDNDANNVAMYIMFNSKIVCRAFFMVYIEPAV